MPTVLFLQFSFSLLIFHRMIVKKLIQNKITIQGPFNIYKCSKMLTVSENYATTSYITKITSFVRLGAMFSMGLFNLIKVSTINEERFCGPLLMRCLINPEIALSNYHLQY
jgi:hypothetical protein